MKKVVVILTVGILTALLTLAALLLFYEPTVDWSEAIRPTPCAVSPETNLLAGVFDAVAGESPIWFVDGSTGVWRKREPVKSLWVLSREVDGSLRVEGRRLDGRGHLEFQQRTDGIATATLDIADPWHSSMRAGGPRVTRMYALVPTYVYYPSAGCWELIARLGNHEAHIVRRLKTEVAAAFDRR